MPMARLGAAPTPRPASPSSAARHARPVRTQSLLTSRLRLLALAVETGGRWSTTCATTVRQLAAAKGRSAPTHLRKTARMAYASRWWALLSVAAQNTLAATVYGDAVGVLDGIDDVEPTTVDVCYEASLAPPVSRLTAR